MRSSVKAIHVLLLLVAAQAGSAHSDTDPLNDPAVQRTLSAMHNASTWYHPDLFGMTTGMLHYAHHEYVDALKYFEIGAFYADKLSQLSIGLMYMNGEGVPSDPVTAYAWLDLAAERDYPAFVATRDNLKPSLSTEQLAQAMQIRKTLAARYGDDVAKWRMAVQLRIGQMQITGSMTGYNGGVSQASLVRCGPALVIGSRLIPQIGCGANSPFLQKDNWRPDLYFAARDREWKSTVSVGPLEQMGKPPEK